MNEIASRRPGSSARLGFLRDGQHLDTTVTIGDRDQVFASLNHPQPAAGPQSEGGAGETKLGVVVHAIPAAMAAKLHTSGVMIDSVHTGSFADLLGLGPGVVITHVNRQPTATKEQFDSVVSKLKSGDDVVFEIVDPRHPELGIDYLGGTL